MPVFDSSEFIKRLAAAGMPEGQAEVLAHEQIQLLADHLATKQELREGLALLRQEMIAGFQRFDEHLDRFDEKVAEKMAAMESRILIKTGIMVATVGGLVFAGLSIVIALVR